MIRSVRLHLDDDEWHALRVMAHGLDITLDELLRRIIVDGLAVREVLLP